MPELEGNKPLSMKIYTRKTLLSLFSSPLVPSTLPDLKPLQEWYGDFSVPVNSNTSKSVSDSFTSTPSDPSINPSAKPIRSNPFSNFGKFGVDGGLDEQVRSSSSIVATNARNGNANANGDKRSNLTRERDGAPHLSPGAGGGADKLDRDRDRDRGGDRRRGVSPSGGTQKFSTSPTNGFTARAALRGDRERERERDPKKDGRAEEGGWRTNSAPDRRSRQGLGLDSRRGLPLDRNAPSDRDRDSSNRSSRPPWMDDGDSSNSPSSPAWMDAPIGGDSPSKPLAGLMFGATLPRPGDNEAGDSRSGDGLDGIQAFKREMKERERREREAAEGKSGGRDEDESRDSGTFNNDAEQQHQTSKPVTSSVFEHLVRPVANSTSTLSDSNPGPGGAASGGRASRFAKFFDGKPPPATAAQPQKSVFDELLGGGSGSKGNSAGPSADQSAPPGPEPSREDKESMARLLGMLQFSGARATSPTATKTLPLPSQQSAPPLTSPSLPPQQQSLPAPTSSISAELRIRQPSGSGSRFAFSQASAAQQSAATTSVAPLPPPLPPTLPSSQPLLPPFISQAQTQPHQLPPRSGVQPPHNPPTSVSSAPLPLGFAPGSPMHHRNSPSQDSRPHQRNSSHTSPPLPSSAGFSSPPYQSYPQQQQLQALTTSARLLPYPVSRSDYPQHAPPGQEMRGGSAHQQTMSINSMFASLPPSSLPPPNMQSLPPGMLQRPPTGNTSRQPLPPSSYGPQQSPMYINGGAQMTPMMGMGLPPQFGQPPPPMQYPNQQQRIQQQQQQEHFGNSGGRGYGGPGGAANGVPDLMALLNSGAGMRGPPSMPPQQQVRPQEGWY